MAEKIREEADEVDEAEKSEIEKVLETPIEELETSMRSFNCLKRAGINSVGELIQRRRRKLQKFAIWARNL